MSDPTDQLADLLDSMETSVGRFGRTARIDETNRINLLFGHALFAIWIAPGFALLYLSGMSSPSYALLRRIPGNPWTMAVLLEIGGVTLAVATWHRRRVGEYVALLIMLTWYGLVSASLLGALILWAAEPGPRDWTTGPSPVGYAVYAHVGYALWTHARSVRKKGLRAAQAQSRPVDVPDAGAQ